MPESYIQVTEGSGKKLHTIRRTPDGLEYVEDEVVVLGEPHNPTYSARFYSISVATTGDHVIELYAGSTNRIRVRKIHVCQQATASAASSLEIHWQRISTAGTGGTSVTPQPFDPDDAAADASAMTLPSSKGTFAATLLDTRLPIYSAYPTHHPGWTWEQLPNEKPMIAAASSGFSLTIGPGRASATVAGFIEFDELVW